MSAQDDSNAVFGKAPRWTQGIGTDNPLNGALEGVDKALEVILKSRLTAMNTQLRTIRDRLDNGR
jgi:hypothetical protein